MQGIVFSIQFHSLCPCKIWETNPICTKNNLKNVSNVEEESKYFGKFSHVEPFFFISCCEISVVDFRVETLGLTLFMICRSSLTELADCLK